MPYQRKTIDEFQIWQYWSGWEEVCCYATRREAVEGLREYRANQPEARVKIVKRRVK